MKLDFDIIKYQKNTKKIISFIEFILRGNQFNIFNTIFLENDGRNMWNAFGRKYYGEFGQTFEMVQICVTIQFGFVQRVPVTKKIRISS